MPIEKRTRKHAEEVIYYLLAFLNFDFNRVLHLCPDGLDYVLHYPVIDLFRGLESTEAWAGKVVVVKNSIMGESWTEYLPGRQWMPEWVLQLRQFRDHLLCMLVPLVVSDPQGFLFGKDGLRITAKSIPTRDWIVSAADARVRLARAIEESRLERNLTWCPGEHRLWSYEINWTTGARARVGRGKKVRNSAHDMLGRGRKILKLWCGKFIVTDHYAGLTSPEQKIYAIIEAILKNGEFANLRRCRCGRFHRSVHRSGQLCELCKSTKAEDWREKRAKEIDIKGLSRLKARCDAILQRTPRGSLTFSAVHGAMPFLPEKHCDLLLRDLTLNCPVEKIWSRFPQWLQAEFADLPDSISPGRSSRYIDTRPSKPRA